MTWAVLTNVCLPTRASRPDTQRTQRSPQLALPRPRILGREACPDNGVTQSSRRSSRRPSSFDKICQATHEYALRQRPLFGYERARSEPRLRSPSSARTAHGCRHAHLAAQKRRMGHPPQGLPAAVDRVSITCQRLRAGAWRAAAADRRWGVYQRRVLVLRQVWI